MMKCTCNICKIEGDFVESTDVVCLGCYYEAQAKAELFDEMVIAMRHAKIFIGSRQRMHSTGIEQHEEILSKAKEL